MPEHSARVCCSMTPVGWQAIQLFAEEAIVPLKASAAATKNLSELFIGNFFCVQIINQDLLKFSDSRRENNFGMKGD